MPERGRRSLGDRPTLRGRLRPRGTPGSPGSVPTQRPDLSVGGAVTRAPVGDRPRVPAGRFGQAEVVSRLGRVSVLEAVDPDTHLPVLLVPVPREWMSMVALRTQLPVLTGLTHPRILKVRSLERAREGGTIPPMLVLDSAENTLPLSVRQAGAPWHPQATHRHLHHVAAALDYGADRGLPLRFDPELVLTRTDGTTFLLPLPTTEAAPAACMTATFARFVLDLLAPVDPSLSDTGSFQKRLQSLGPHRRLVMQSVLSPGLQSTPVDDCRDLLRQLDIGSPESLDTGGAVSGTPMVTSKPWLFRSLVAGSGTLILLLLASAIGVLVRVTAPSATPPEQAQVGGPDLINVNDEAETNREVRRAQRGMARDQRGLAMGRGLRIALLMHYSDLGFYPESLDEASFAPYRKSGALLKDWNSYVAGADMERRGNDDFRVVLTMLNGTKVEVTRDAERIL